MLAVYSATKEALDRARSGGGPTLLEMLTYRVGAHSTSDDPRAYRAQDEVDPWTAKDPIERMRKYLTKKKLWSAATEEAMKKSIVDRIQTAIDNAEKTPPPPLSSLFSDVYTERPWHLVEQENELSATLEAGYRPNKGHGA